MSDLSDLCAIVESVIGNVDPGPVGAICREHQKIRRAVDGPRGDMSPGVRRLVEHDIYQHEAEKLLRGRRGW